jgi:ATP-dependent RNA helicase DDX3X
VSGKQYYLTLHPPGASFANSSISHTVMDEADELMHSDWDENMRMILTSSDLTEDTDGRYYMFSATFPKEFRKVAKTFMAEDWVRIRVGRTGSSHENIKQVIMYVDDNNKRDAIWHVLFANPPCRTMIFVNSKKNADILDDFLFNKGLPTTSIHADRTQREREDSIISFRQGTSPILITTGVAARGLDIKHVLHVINYDLPPGMHDGLEEYVHRIGRTARIGHEGRATSFYNARNEELAEGLVKLLIESHQPVPGFLDNYKPLDDQLTWDDDSDEDDEAAEGAVDSAIAGGEWGDVPPEPGFTANSSAAGNGDSGFAGSSGVDSGFAGSGFDANAAEPVFEW